MNDDKKKKKIAYNNEYNKKHYDRINMFIPQGYKDKVKDRASSLNMAMSDYIFTLVSNDLNGITVSLDEKRFSDEDMAMLKKWRIATEYYDMIESISHDVGSYVITLKRGYINDDTKSRFVYAKNREEIRTNIAKSHKKPIENNNIKC